VFEQELDGDATGLSGIIISDGAGVEIPNTYFEGGGDGEPCCGDGECNGNETSDSCPEDCGDDCPSGIYDCAGVCDGDSVIDACGSCDGPGAEYECWDGEMVCEASDCSNEPGTDPFNFNQSTMFAYYFVFSAYDCPGEYLVAGEDWIGVYNDDVCVGGSVWPGGPTEVPAYGDDGNDYSAGYLNSGDTPTFKIYDASEDVYLDAIASEEYGWAPNGIYQIESLTNSMSGCDAEQDCWVDIPGDYQLTASMTAVVYIDGGAMGDAGDMLAAFDASGNVRGISTMLDGLGSYAGQSLHSITIRSNAGPDAISFRYYDASTDIIYDLRESYTFVSNDTVGNLMTPHMLSYCTSGIVDECGACGDGVPDVVC
jgi:hypothetical protein